VTQTENVSITVVRF